MFLIACHTKQALVVNALLIAHSNLKPVLAVFCSTVKVLAPALQDINALTAFLAMQSRCSTKLQWRCCSIDCLTGSGELLVLTVVTSHSSVMRETASSDIPYRLTDVKMASSLHHCELAHHC